MGRLFDDPQSKNGIAFLMDWTRILADAGIPDSPGRPEAIAAARLFTEKRKAAKEQPAKPKAKPKAKPRPKR